MIKLTRLLCFGLLLLLVATVGGTAGIYSGAAADPDNLENLKQEISGRSSFTVGDLEINLRLAPAAEFPVWTGDGGTDIVDAPFWIAETQVTYELWYEVRKWAENNGYTFASPGCEGTNLGRGSWSQGFEKAGIPPTARKKEPVTMVDWSDCVVWCNALSEFLELTPVYIRKGAVLRDSNEFAVLGGDPSSTFDADEVEQREADGFRLPTRSEWELAARYQGDDSSHDAIFLDGLYWTPGSHASGGIGPIYPWDEEARAQLSEIAWYEGNSDVDGDGMRTQAVGLKEPNTLGLYDMSGNVWEWCFTAAGPGGNHRAIKGGHWHGNERVLRVGYNDSQPPEIGLPSIGFRLARNR